MYIINPTTKITSITASSEDASYLKENVEDDFRTNLWKSTSSSLATLTLSVSSGAQAIGIAYTNAPTVRVLVSGGVHDSTYTMDTYHPNLFVNYGTVATAHTVTLAFADPGTTVPYCGIIRCSNIHEFKNPRYGLNEGMTDYSVKKRTNNGALYYLQRNIVRTFSGSIDVNRDTEFWVFMHQIAMSRGSAPMFWQITDINKTDWGVFAELNDMPSGSHDNPEDSTISFSLTEAI